MWTIGVCRGVWQYAPLSLSQKPRKSQKGDRLTQIKQIDRIIGTDLRNQRETIPVTRCERTLAEIADTAEAGTSGQDANHPSPQHHNRLVTSAINRVSGYSLCNLMLTASKAMPATWGKHDETQRHQPWSGCRFSNKGNSRPLFLDDKACDICEIVYYGIAFTVGVKCPQFGVRAEKAATRY